MQNKRSFFVIFTAILSLHVYLFSSLKITNVQKQTKPMIKMSPFYLKNVKIISEVKEKNVSYVKNKEIKSIDKKKIKKVFKKDKKKIKKIKKKIKKTINSNHLKKPKKYTKIKNLVKNKKPYVSVNQKKVLIEKYLSELKMLIEKNKIYPKKAKRLNQEGLVMLKVKILENGNFSSLIIKNESRYKRLNKAALKILKDIKKFKKIPKELEKKSWVIDIPIEYKIASN